jgi:hypothetical protein
VSACTVYQLADGTYIQTATPAGLKDSGMKRLVKVTPINTNNEYTVDVEVDYPAGPQMRQIKLHDTIMNWFPVLPI